MHDDRPRPTRVPQRLPAVEETSAGGVVINVEDGNAHAAIIARRNRAGRIEWCLPKGHIEAGETLEETAEREVAEETGIVGRVLTGLGTIDYWFATNDHRVHKVVHHYLLEATGGELSVEGDPDCEAIDAAWVRLDQISRRLTFPNERRIAQAAWERLAGDRVSPRRAGLATVGALLATVAVLFPGIAGTAAPKAATFGRVVGTLSAAAASGGLSVALISVSPPVAKVGTSVIVTGSVTNLGTAPVAGTSVQVLLGRLGLPLRPDVTAWAHGTSSPPLVVSGQQTLVAQLSPGVATHFTVTVPAASIHNAQSFAVLPMQITATSRPGAAGTVAAVGSLRSFLPWLNSPKRYVPVSLAWVVPVTLDADPLLFDVDGASRTAAWTRALGPTSRLQRVLAAAKGKPVTWAIDPAVLGPRPSAEVSGATGQTDSATPTTSPTSSPATPSNSSNPSTPSGSTSTTRTSGSGTSTPATNGTGTSTPTTATSAATRALTDGVAESLRTITRSHPVWSLPYADPDVAAVLAAAPTDRSAAPLLSTPTTLAHTLKRSVRDDISWPADEVLTPTRERQLRSLYDDAPLTAAVVAAPPVTALANTTKPADQKSAGGLPLLAADPALSTELVAATTSTATPAARTAGLQLFLADSMALLSELPGRARSVLVAAPRSYSPDVKASASFWSAVDSATWLQSTSTTSVLHQAVDAEPATASATGGSALAGASVGAAAPIGALSPGVSPLTRARLAGIAATRSTVEGVASVLPDGTAFSSAWLDAEDQLLSARWRGQRKAFDRLQVNVRHATGVVSDGIRVRTTSVNFFAAQGQLQVTVVNDLAEPVHGVRLTLIPASPKLLIQSQPELLSIGSESRNQVRVPVRAVAAGLVQVDARLTAANGTVLGPRAQMIVRVQPPGSWLYWAMGGVAGLVLLTGIARSLRRGRRPDDSAPAVTAADVTVEPAA